MMFAGADDVCRLGVKESTQVMRKKRHSDSSNSEKGTFCTLYSFYSIISFIQIRFIQNVPFFKKIEYNYYPPFFLFPLVADWPIVCMH
jgi:hypothetical protein